MQDNEQCLSVVCASDLTEVPKGLPAQLASLQKFITGFAALNSYPPLQETLDHISEVMESLEEGPTRLKALTLRDVILLSRLAKELHSSAGTVLHITKRMNREFLSQAVPGVQVNDVFSDVSESDVPYIRSRISI